MKYALASLSCIVALALPGCAAFQANPTPAECTQAQNELQTANASLAVAQLALANAKAAGASAATLAQISNDITIVQADVTFFQNLVNANCAVATPAS